MSVINKVLRDLDQRQSGRLKPDRVMPGTAVPRGDLDQHGPARGRATFRLGRTVGLACAVVVAVLVLGAYLAGIGLPTRDPLPVAVAVAPAPAASTASWTPASEPLTVVAESAATVPTAPTGVTQPTQTTLRPSVPDAPRSRSLVSPLPAVSAAVTALPAASTTVSAASVPLMRETVTGRANETPTRSVPASAVGSVTGGATSETANLALAMQDALAQAQRLWQQGQPTAALDLLGAVITRLEADAGQDVRWLSMAAREYVRVTVAQGRAVDALAMLTRLEPRLRQVADIWALRGNTAQRLGLHAQAVHAYMQALELSPGQARWMLAAAVSLAAQGQTTRAADMAENARRAGFLPTDVANYLHQLGVTLRAP